MVQVGFNGKFIGLHDSHASNGSNVLNDWLKGFK